MAKISMVRVAQGTKDYIDRLATTYRKHGVTCRKRKRSLNFYHLYVDVASFKKYWGEGVGHWK